MAWRRPGDKPLFEAMMVIYRRIYESLGLNELIAFISLMHILFIICRGIPRYFNVSWTNMPDNFYDVW